MRSVGGVSLALVVACLLQLAGCAAPERPYNVLFIVVDDLRPELNVTYGHEYMHTPNLDALAAQSMVFDRAYCQEAVCAPSRNSFMSGRRPDTTKAWNFIDHFREPGVGADWVSLPQYFKNHGYYTWGGGKLYHPNLPPKNDEPLSWSQEIPYFPVTDEPCPKGTKTPFCSIDAPLDSFFDHRLSEHTIGLLEAAALNYTDKPFFIGAGFRRPHVSWRAPPRFFDLYNASMIATATHPTAPSGMPDIAFTTEGAADIHHWPRAYGPNDPEPHDSQQLLRRGYYAAVSFVDEQIGAVLKALDHYGLSNNTIVSLNGDHGWQLGEHGEWAKHTNFELAARVPMMVRVPSKPQTAGKRSSAIVELIDMYPTLAELAGLPTPPDLNGTSFAPYFDNHTMPSLKDAAFFQFPRCPKNLSRMWDENICLSVPRTEFYSMGYSVRTTQYRYTEWLKWNGTRLHGEWSDVVGVELYDHAGDTGTDFNAFENENLAAEPSMQAVVKEMHVLLVKNYGE
ncbi:iduronate 2-sulfatase-like [Sycon ciliatum]|uniref:iduronate 2-sulfatase-like n=1 Tax=Sycon ciliatum TaxID=27933 RepID=UPI0031F69D50